MEEAVRKEFLYHQLSSLGDFYKLQYYINPSIVREQLQSYGDRWVYFNPQKKGLNRYGLSVTSLDGKMSGYPDLTSIAEYNQRNDKKINELDFNKFTELYSTCTEIQPLLKDFKPFLGRSHFIKLGMGGLFPYHRDVYTEYDETFRIFVPLYHHNSRDFVFLLGMDRIFLESGAAYFINTRIEHALFSLHEESLFLVLNVKLCQETVDLVKKNLGSR